MTKPRGTRVIRCHHQLKRWVLEWQICPQKDGDELERFATSYRRLQTRQNLPVQYQQFFECVFAHMPGSVALLGRDNRAGRFTKRKRSV